MMRTNSKQYLQNFAKYFADCCDTYPDYAPLREELERIAKRFKEEYGYENAVRRNPNTQNRLAEWLSGLSLNLDYYNGDILTAASILHECPIPEHKHEKILENWFPHCATMILRLAKAHDVTFN